MSNTTISLSAVVKRLLNQAYGNRTTLSQDMISHKYTLILVLNCEEETQHSVELCHNINEEN